MPTRTEYTGQCVDGPDVGNLLSSTTRRISFSSTSRWQLDGPNAPWTVQTIEGVYEWREETGGYHWIRGRMTTYSTTSDLPPQ
jgi:hypothetical protein